MVRLLALIILQIYLTQGFFPETPKMQTMPLDGGDSGEPLFLTPYIEAGDIEEGQRLARVNLPGVFHSESYSGFLTVNKTYNSNLFFWYFPAIYKTYIPDKKHTSLLIYLQGFPGLTSLYGQFEQNGRIEVVQVNNKTEFRKRFYNWNMLNNVIYIDHSVGAGFSFTNDTRGYCTDMTQTGDQLYTALYQIYQLFPEFQANYLFLTGELYAGKYATALARTIHQRNPTAKIKMELKSMIIASPWCDPINQMVYHKYFYEMGIFDWEMTALTKQYEINTTSLIKQEKWIEALNNFEEALGLMQLHSGLLSYYNILKGIPRESPKFVALVQTSQSRKALHVGDLEFQDGKNARNALKADFMKSVVPWLPELLLNYKIFFISGALGAMVPPTSMTNFMKKLDPLLVNATVIPILVVLRSEFRLSGVMTYGCNKLDGKPSNLTNYLIPNIGNLLDRDQEAVISSLINVLLQE